MPQPRLSLPVGLAAPRCGRRCPENMAGWSIRDARATRGIISRRDATGCCRRGEVGGEELERLGWRQVQHIPAAPGVAPSFLPSLSSSFLSPLPLFLIPAQPLSCLPDPRPSPPLGCHFQVQGQNPPARAVTCEPPSGCEVRLGHCRSPDAHSAAARLIPASLNGPSGSCSFYEARNRGTAPASLASSLWRRQRQCVLFTLGGWCWVPRECAASHPPPSTRSGWGWRDKHGFQGTQQRRGVTWSRSGVARKCGPT